MPAWIIVRSIDGAELDGPMVQTMRVRRIWLTGEPQWPDGPQLEAGDCKVAGQDAETKEGVALGGAHLACATTTGRAP